MTFAKLTASTAALLLSSTALLAQETQSQAFQSVFIDVGGTTVLVPTDVALEACGFDRASLQSVAESRLQESGVDQAQFLAQMESATAMTGQGDAATQDNATAGVGDTNGDGAAADTAMVDAGATTSDMGNTSDIAAADASSAASQDPTAADTGISDVQNVEPTAADTTDDADAIGAVNADLLLVLAVCQIDQSRAAELRVDMTQTGSNLGFDAATLGLQSGTANP